MASPADIIKAWLIAQDLGENLSGSPLPDWVVYTDVMPDNNQAGSIVRDAVICVYDTLGNQQARNMKDGEQYEHPGVMIHVRGNRGAGAKASAYNKAAAIWTALDSLLRYPVTLDGTPFVVQSFNKSGTILPLGVEGDSQRRFRYSMNGVISWGA